MSEAKTQPIFVPKQEGQVALGMDECLDMIIAEQAKKKEIDTKIKALKAVAKQLLVAKGVTSYESPTGRKAKWSESNRPKYNIEAIRQLTGTGFDMCVTYSVVRSFKVT